MCLVTAVLRFIMTAILMLTYVTLSVAFHTISINLVDVGYSDVFWMIILVFKQCLIFLGYVLQIRVIL